MWTVDRGIVVEFNVGESFVEGVLRTAQENELGKFRVFINDEEIEPDDAPEMINEGDVVVLQKYDVAG